jgi:hypothetical protein
MTGLPEIKLMPATLGEDTTAPRAYTVIVTRAKYEETDNYIAHVTEASVLLAQVAAQSEAMEADTPPSERGFFSTNKRYLDVNYPVIAVFAGHHMDIHE